MHQRGPDPLADFGSGDPILRGVPNLGDSKSVGGSKSAEFQIQGGPSLQGSKFAGVKVCRSPNLRGSKSEVSKFQGSTLVAEMRSQATPSLHYMYSVCKCTFYTHLCLIQNMSWGIYMTVLLHVIVSKGSQNNLTNCFWNKKYLNAS